MAGSEDQGASHRGRMPRSAESWIEISSQTSPFMSTVDQESLVAGLQQSRRDPLRTRRRLSDRGPSIQYSQPRVPILLPLSSGATSSQEEYSESDETDPDPMLTSSNEALPPFNNDSVAHQASLRPEHKNRDCFTPQPNAFSHPPSSSHRSHERPVPGSYFPASAIDQEGPMNNDLNRISQRQIPSVAPRVASTPSSRSHAPHPILSPSHQADHDAALRASLSTLFSLSSAAAARNSNKTKGGNSAQRSLPSVPTSMMPTTLRIIPESDAMLAGSRLVKHSSESSSQGDTVEATEPSSKEKEKSKRRGSAARSSSKERRAAKKQRTGIYTATEEIISPTLLTWVVSAGVLVVVSALSFSAGYVVGGDGRLFESTSKAGSAAGGAGTVIRCGDCGTEVAKSGLRRWRWSGPSLRA